MAKKKQPKSSKISSLPSAYIAGAGIVAEEKITETLEKTICPMQ